MGWNNRDSLGCDVSQTLLLDISRALLNTSLRNVGYKYVVLDDCWLDGFIVVDQKKFLRG
jgi:alpha-galactosidase